MKGFSVFKSIVNFVSGVFGGGGDPRNERQYSGGARDRDLGLVDKYGGFLSKIGPAARTAMGQEEDGFTPFQPVSDVSVPKIPLGSSRAAQAPALGGISSQRLNLAVQTAMRRKTQSNQDFQRLISQNTPQPRPVRGRRTLAIEPARLPSVQEAKPAEVRKETK